MIKIHRITCNKQWFPQELLDLYANVSMRLKTCCALCSWVKIGKIGCVLEFHVTKKIAELISAVSSFWIHLSGTAISDVNGKSHKPQATAWQTSRKNESRDSCCVTFGFHVYLLHTSRTFNLCTIWGSWINGNFLMDHWCLLPGVLLPSFPNECPEPLLLLGRYPYLLEGFPCASEVVTHIKKSEASFLRLWNTLEISVPVLTQRQDNQNKI